MHMVEAPFPVPGPKGPAMFFFGTRVFPFTGAIWDYNATRVDIVDSMQLVGFY